MLTLSGAPCYSGTSTRSLAICCFEVVKLSSLEDISWPPVGGETFVSCLHPLPSQHIAWLTLQARVASNWKMGGLHILELDVSTALRPGGICLYTET